MVAAILLGISVILFSQWILSTTSFRISDNHYLISFLAIAVLALSLLGYMIPKIYYFPYALGILGDNYHHLHQALEPGFFIKSHHTIFPLVSELFLNGLIKYDFLDPKDPEFLEKYFALSIVPVTIISLCGLTIFSHLIKYLSDSWSNFYLAFLLIGTSFGYWIWSIQSNSLAIAFSLQLITFYIFVKWTEKQNLPGLILLTLFICLGPWVHIALIYWSIGLFISVLIFIMKNDHSRIRKILETILCSVIILLAGFLFYKAQAIINGLPDINDLFKVLADSEHQGGFGVGENIIKGLGKNLVIGLNSMTSFPPRVNLDIVPDFNYLNILFPVKSGFPTLSHHILFYSFILYSGKLIYRERNHLNKGLLIPSFVVSVCILVGFLFRQAGQHYYVLAMIPNFAILLNVFTLRNIGSQEMTVLKVLAIAVILNATLNNIFTKSNVFKGRDINELSYYADNRHIADHISPGDSAVYFQKENLHSYHIEAISLYYQPEFGRIKWVQPPENSDWDNEVALLDSIKMYKSRGFKIYLGKTAHRVMGDAKCNPISDSIWKLN